MFDEDEKGVGREGSSEFPYLLMLIKLWPGDWKNQLNSMNQKADEDNGKAMGKGNGRYQKVCWFSSHGIWKNIGCLVSVPTFGLGGLRLWEKKEDVNISEKKRKICSIWIKVDLYEVCLSKIIHCLLFYFKTILIPFLCPAKFVVSLSMEFRKYWPKLFE